MAVKAYTWDASGGLVPIAELEVATSISAVGGAVVLNSSGITMGVSKNIALNGGTVSGLPTTPTLSGDAASKAYVESYANSVASGLDVKKSVVAATTAALSVEPGTAVTYDNGTSGVGATLTANANGAIGTIDGVALVEGDRILIKNQAAAEQNGIYTLTQAGAIGAPFIFTRATDADTGGATGEVTPGMFCFVEAGTTNGDTGWVLSAPDTAIVMGDNTNGLLTFTKFSSSASYTAGNGLGLTGSNLFLDLNELTDTALDVGNDSFSFIDASDTNASKKETVADFIGFVAGTTGGLTATAGVLSVNPDNTTIELNTNALRLKDGGVSAAKLATGSVTALKTVLLGTALTVDLVSNAAITDPEMKVAVINTANGKAQLFDASVLSQPAGLFVTAAVAGANVAVDLYTLDGTFLTIPSAARGTVSFTVGATVYVDDAGILTTDYASAISPGNYTCPVGLAVSTTEMILRIGSPFQKAT